MRKPRIAIFYGDKPNTGQYDNGVWMDILKIPYIQQIEEANNYDIVIGTLWLEAIGWRKEIRKRFPHVIQIGLSDHPLSSQISKMQAPAQVAYLRDLEALDAIMVLTEEEREFYQVALPSKPVMKVGLPFPFESYEETFGKFKNSDQKFIGLGVGASDNDRNFISNVLVFNRLRLEYPDIQGVFLSIPEPLMPYCYYLCQQYEGLYIQERVGMEQYYNTLSQCKFIINLADRNTPGRLQGEAAFFGIPVIGSNRFELQTELFPSLAVSPYALQRATSLATALLNDPLSIQPALKKAVVNLHKYDYKSSRRKFNMLLNQIRG